MESVSIHHSVKEFNFNCEERKKETGYYSPAGRFAKDGTG